MEFGWVTRKDIKEKLDGLDCILSLESAADYLGLSNGAPTNKITVYSTENLNIEGIECVVVADYSDIDYIKDNGILHTTIEQTIIDILRYDRDLETILSSLANYYFGHGESFEQLVKVMPKDVLDVFKGYEEDAKEYYDE